MKYSLRWIINDMTCGVINYRFSVLFFFIIAFRLWDIFILVKLLQQVDLKLLTRF